MVGVVRLFLFYCFIGNLSKLRLTSDKSLHSHFGLGRLDMGEKKTPHYLYRCVTITGCELTLIKNYSAVTM